MSGAEGPVGWRGGDLSVRGGSGGLAVALDALDQAARAVAEVAEEAAFVAGVVAARLVDADLVAAAALSPTTGAIATASLAEVSGPLGLAGEAAALVELAATVRAASAAYRAGEAAAQSAVERVQDAVLLVAGWMAPELVVGTLTLDALGVDVVGQLDHLAFEHPQVADLAGGTEGLLLGLRANPLTAPLVTARRRDDGVGGPPAQDDRDLGYEHAVRTLADSAALWGLLDDRGRALVIAEPAPRPGAVAPSSLRDLAAAQADVGDGERYGGHVRVIEVPQQQGSVWVVEISATQDWDPRAGDNPFDVTTDVRSVAQEATVLADGVHQALAAAQAASARADGSVGPSAEPAAVLLVGHSLGGIAAAGLASSPAFTREHRVTHVVTMGSPVARMPIPAVTQVLSLEHTRDPVPRLEGQPNPDRATWVTVSRDAHGAGVDRASRTHDVHGYVDTAARVDASTDPSVVSWRSGSSAFFDEDTHGEPVVRDFAIRRVQP